MSRWGYYDDYYFPKSQPRAAKGGIKAQSKRGTFGESWWAKRWIDVLERFDIGSRLQRGRSYARKGQVLSIDIGKSTVKAKVQGSRPTPYTVTISVKPLPASDWRKLTTTLSAQALFAAKLLAGEMPRDIEEAFTAAGLSLFPEKLQDLTTECSCPDWSNPCKHIAAVYYLLGEEFDRDPFLLFKLRGLSREELVGQLSGAGAPQQQGKTAAKRTAKEPVVSTPVVPSEPLPADTAKFWNGESLPEDIFGEVQTPPVAAALPTRLGDFPFWRGTERFLDAIEPVYTHASRQGLEVFLGGGLSD
jgi:uncharacterized Zn finger protein